MSETVNITPINQLDQSDPGDDVLRRFKYQHAYGVILLANGLMGQLPCLSIWCEQHEDFLVQIDDKKFDFYQIKTRQDGLSAWKVTEEKFKNSIKRFIEHEISFETQIDKFIFLTNYKYYETTSVNDLDKSPISLKDAVDQASDVSRLCSPYIEVIQNQALEFDCTEEIMFSVWKKIELRNGPSLNDFDSVVPHKHLSQIKGCDILSAPELNRLRDELIGMIFKASSIPNDDPSMDWLVASITNGTDPRLEAKQITIEMFEEKIMDFLDGNRTPTFMFSGTESPFSLNHHNSLSILEKKAIKGGLNEMEILNLRRRTISAEQHLLKLTKSLSPEEAEKMLTHVDGVVSAICSDAYTESYSNSVFGRGMYKKALNRLRDQAKNHSTDVLKLQHDCLVGVAGILTEECKVWWSDKFDMTTGAAI